MKFKIEKNYIILFVALFFFWVILSPRMDIAAIILGIFIAGIITIFNHQMIVNRNERPVVFFKNITRFISYLVVLLVEIIKSNIHVAKIVLDPKLPIDPHMIKIPVKSRKEIYQVLYGNSITLTPGTLTVDIADGMYIVHALTKEAAKGLEDSVLEKKILEIEGGHND